MTEAEGLAQIRDILGAALPPDSGATIGGLMSDIMGVLDQFDLNPVAPDTPVEVH